MNRFKPKNAAAAWKHAKKLSPAFLFLRKCVPLKLHVPKTNYSCHRFALNELEVQDVF